MTLSVHHLLCLQEVEDIMGSADAFVEVSPRPKHLTTKPLLSSSTPTAKLAQVGLWHSVSLLLESYRTMTPVKPQATQ